MTGSGSSRRASADRSAPELSIARQRTTTADSGGCASSRRARLRNTSGRSKLPKPASNRSSDLRIPRCFWQQTCTYLMPIRRHPRLLGCAGTKPTVAESAVLSSTDHRGGATGDARALTSVRAVVCSSVTGMPRPRERRDTASGGFLPVLPGTSQSASQMDGMCGNSSGVCPPSSGESGGLNDLLLSSPRCRQWPRTTSVERTPSAGEP